MLTDGIEAKALRAEVELDTAGRPDVRRSAQDSFPAIEFLGGKDYDLDMASIHMAHHV